MKKTKTLKKNYEFKAVLSKGKFFVEKEIEIFILKNNKKANFLGIAIGTKNGKAFQRNKAKRIIRECYTKLENQIVDGNTKICAYDHVVLITEAENSKKILSYFSGSSE